MDVERLFRPREGGLRVPGRDTELLQVDWTTKIPVTPGRSLPLYGLEHVVHVSLLRNPSTFSLLCNLDHEGVRYGESVSGRRRDDLDCVCPPAAPFPKELTQLQLQRRLLPVATREFAVLETVTVRIIEVVRERVRQLSRDLQCDIFSIVRLR